MIDNVLIAVILLLFITSFLIVYVWKKKKYTKELYISNAVSLTLYVIVLSITTGLIACYYIFPNDVQYSWLYLLIVLVFDIVMLLIYCIEATLCIRLSDDNVLCKKTIFTKREIKIDKETRIVEKFDKTIIKSKGKSITLGLRYLSGSVNNVRYKINQAINQQTGIDKYQHK